MNPRRFLAAFLAAGRSTWRALDELACHRHGRCQSYGMPASTRPAAPPSARTEKERARLLAALTAAERAKLEGRDG